MKSLIAVAFLSASGLIAGTTYTYTGQPFTRVCAGFNCPNGGPPYTTSDFISGSITMAAAFGANVPWGDVDPATILAWTFSDGVQTITSADGSELANAAVATDVAGNIHDWEFFVCAAPVCGSSADHTIETFNITGAVVEDQVSLVLGTSASQETVAGTWTLVPDAISSAPASSTPEPSALPLVGLMLAGCAYRARFGGGTPGRG